MATKKTEKIEETAQDTGKSEAQAAPEAAVEPKAVPDASPEQLVTQDENGLLSSRSATVPRRGRSER